MKRVADPLNRVGQRQVRDVQRPEQRRRERGDEIDPDAGQAHERGRARILAGIKRKHERLVNGGERQPVQVKAQDLGGGQRVLGVELAMLKDQRHNRPRQHEQADRGRDDEHQDELEAVRQRGEKGAVDRRGASLRRRFFALARQGGQDGDGNGGRHQAERKLDQRRRVIHPRDAARARVRSQVVAQVNRHLADDEAHGDGDVEPKDAAQGRMPPVERQAQVEAAQPGRLEQRSAPGRPPGCRRPCSSRPTAIQITGPIEPPSR